MLRSTLTAAVTRHPAVVATLAIVAVAVTASLAGDVGQLAVADGPAAMLGTENGTLVEPQDGSVFEGPTGIGDD